MPSLTQTPHIGIGAQSKLRSGFQHAANAGEAALSEPATGALGKLAKWGTSRSQENAFIRLPHVNRIRPRRKPRHLHGTSLASLLYGDRRPGLIVECRLCAQRRTSRPLLSHPLHPLETELGTQLLHRSAQGVKPTEAG
ncbi:helix-turn-helix domain-containing protein [Xanthobacter autotrophicus]|uniref:helix-turn-helix domain-containing protein n=1 Tax=Xanthobacter autotrophicus TaxID=280 RepID=UPI00372D2E51